MLSPFPQEEVNGTGGKEKRNITFERASNDEEYPLVFLLNVDTEKQKLWMEGMSDLWTGKMFHSSI
jgi:hypothetical protein